MRFCRLGPRTQPAACLGAASTGVTFRGIQPLSWMGLHTSTERGASMERDGGSGVQARKSALRPGRRTNCRRGRRLLLLPVVALAAITVGSPLPARAAGPPPIRHVWVINEENGQVCVNPSNSAYGAVLTGTTGCPLAGAGDYLRTVLPAEGTLVENYFGIGHESLDNYIAEVSGQAPNPATQADCADATYSDLTPGTVDGPQQQAIGQGCVFPSRVKTIADQLQAQGLTWRGYMEDMGIDRAKDATGPKRVAGSGRNCSLSDLNANEAYLAKHDPFVWFHSIIDDQAYCDSHVVPLTGLRSDLQRIDTTPNLSFITPNMSDDGHDTGPAEVSAWSAYWVRQIMASPAYRQDGMIVIVYDENSDSNVAGPPQSGQIRTSCCGELPGPNSPSPGAFGSAGGGETGAWIVTPYGTPGTIADTDPVTPPAFKAYNHYSLLRSLEDLFGITTGGADGQGHLGYAAGDVPPPGDQAANAAVGFRSFGCDDIFTTACPPMTGQVPAQAAPRPSTNVGPRPADGSAKWLNPSPQGDDLNGISCASATQCVAVGATGTIGSTGDGGSTWTSRSSGTTADLNGVSCPARSQLCVAGGAGGLILGSSDGGQTWSVRSSGAHRDLNGVSCPSASACYAVGDAGTIVASRDGGASWASQSSQTAQDLAQIVCVDASTCYAAGDFQAVPGSDCTVGSSCQRAQPDILATSDAGQTWSARAPFPQENPRLRGIACTDANDCVAGDEEGRAWTTQNGFQSVSQKWFPPNRLLGASCGGGGSCVLVGEFGSIVETSNGSVTGSQTLPSGADLQSVSCPSPRTCYAVGRHGVILASGDGGAAWARSGRDAAASNLRTRIPGGSGGTTSGSLDLAGTSCPSATSCVAVGSLGAILTSADAGSRWAARGGLNAPGSDPFDLPFSPDADGPPSFIHPTPSPESPAVHPLDAASCASASSCVAVGELGKVMSTSDLGGGGTWSAQSSNTTNRLTGVSCPKGSSTCFAVGDYGTVLKSANRGSTWASQDSATKSFLNGVSCADASHCVAVGVQGTILATGDGANWRAMPSPTNAYLSSVSCASASSCLAVGSAGTALGSDDGGQSWSVRGTPSGDDLYAVSCTTATDCVATGSAGTVATTADGGNSWNVQGTGTTDALRSVNCPSPSGCFAAGANGAVLEITPHPLTRSGKCSSGCGGGNGSGGAGSVLSGLGFNTSSHSESLGRRSTCRGGSAPTTTFLTARLRAGGLAAAWTFRSRRSLPPGTYRILARGQDLFGNVEHPRRTRRVLLR
ncbi:MAG: hypothetical protein E6G56_13455 [Actinobacteria bacterium]|nr:MAG: hypothetical protein E6G56_13455 [Actinomycetota bacterium]